MKRRGDPLICECCGQTGIRTSPNQKYCSRACNNRMVVARLRHEVPCASCGATIHLARHYDKAEHFCPACLGKRYAGPIHASWKGGIWTEPDGRARFGCRDGTKMLYARAVMAGHIGRLPEVGEHVHHINRDRTDDRIENLQLMSHSAHSRLHALELAEGRRREAA